MNKVSVNISRIRIFPEIAFCVKNSWKVTFVLTVNNLAKWDSPFIITLQYEIHVVI